MGYRSLALVFCGLCAFTPLGWAQSTTDGALGGIITDPSSAAIPGATVTARNLATNATATSQTDINGRYIIIHLQPGVYDLEANAKSLATVKRSQITVEVG